MSDATWIALLRGINVGGHNKIPMAELRQCCATIGCRAVQSYIQSGNLVFSADSAALDLETKLERLIAEHFKLEIPVIVRSTAQWAGYLHDNPFPAASGESPNLVTLVLSKSAPLPGVADALQERARDGERVQLVGEALWIHSPAGSARSRLTPSVLDRSSGSPVTARNWRTVQKIAQLMAT